MGDPSVDEAFRPSTGVRDEDPWVDPDRGDTGVTFGKQLAVDGNSMKAPSRSIREARAIQLSRSDPLIRIRTAPTESGTLRSSPPETGPSRMDRPLESIDRLLRGADAVERAVRLILVGGIALVAGLAGGIRSGIEY